MYYNQPLTLEQKQFAEAHHDIIYSFLRFRKLDFDFYDIVVFGFLRAIQKYFNLPELQQYSFKTIAYWSMTSDLYNHYRKLYRLKRNAVVISLDTPVYDDGLNLLEIIEIDNTDTNSLLDDIADLLPADQFKIVKMKSEGYKDIEIAKKYGIPVDSIQETLLSVKELVYSSLV